MNFFQYIDNPLGKKNAVFSQRGMFKELYEKKFDAVFMREAGKINYQLFYDKGKDRYYIHLKIPSEVVPKFYYDVVIRFSSANPLAFSSNSLKDYDIRVFSNDPAFCFTYLRVFLKNDMFIDDLKPKAPKLALKKDPKERNPYGLVGYVKSLYFAFLFMKNKNLFDKYFYKTNGLKYDKKVLLANVEDAEVKIAQRQEKAKNLAIDEKRAKKQAQQVSKPRQVYSTKQQSTMSITPTTKSASNGVKKVNSVKKTHSITSGLRKRK